MYQNLASKQRLKVLVISESFPNPIQASQGTFVERQTTFLKPYCECVVVAPVRVFPHLRLWRPQWPIQKTLDTWRNWLYQAKQVPFQWEIEGTQVYYPRFTSLPKQGFHGTWGYFEYFAIHPLLKQLHKQHRFDVIHAHWAVPAGTVALLAQHWMRVPVVVSIHGYELAYSVHQKPFGKAAVKNVFEQADALVAQSTYTHSNLSNHGADLNRVHIVRLGANPRAVKAQNEGQLATCKLLTVAHLNKGKAHALVLHTVRHLNDSGYHVHYTIVGDGPERQTLEELVRSLSLAECVRFVGAVSNDEVWQHYADCDLFVLPSINEAFGVVYIEALSMGKAVIGCRGQGGPDDIRSLGDCIELVEPNDLNSLISTIKRLIDDPQRRAEIGERGRQIVQEHYTWERSAHDLFQVYQKAISHYHRS